MLEKLNLDVHLGKEEYQARWPVLRDRLYDLERTCWETGIPSVIVFEGWDASGKGTTINKISQRLDPRGFKLYAIQAPRTTELHMPWLWRFWIKLPNYGEMGIFDRSWYGRVLVERVEKLTPQREWMAAYKDIVDFERTLADDGYTIIKFFLHISKKEQKRRFEKIQKDPLESWHVQPEDWEHHRKYGKYLVAVEEMLERTETEWGPWTIVEATDRHYAQVKVIETMIRRLEEALRRKGVPLPVEIGEEAMLEPLQASQGLPEADRGVQKGEAAAVPELQRDEIQPDSDATKSLVSTWENEGGASVEGSLSSQPGGENGETESQAAEKSDLASQGEG